jgi:hypothetical protein
LNPNLAEKSIHDIIQSRKDSLAKRFSQVQKNAVINHSETQSKSKSRRDSVKLSIKSDIIAYQMEKFQILLELDGITIEMIEDSLSVLKNRNNVF